jgi:hypothetical protein
MRTICADLAPGGIHGGWGRSAFDHRHYLSMIYVWAIPGVHSGNAGWNGFLSAGTNHWTVSGTSQFQIGPASSAGISNIDTNGDGQFNDRPHLGSASASIFTLGEDGTYVWRQSAGPSRRRTPLACSTITIGGDGKMLSPPSCLLSETRLAAGQR